MEKSKEGQPQTRFSSLETFDTRPVKSRRDSKTELPGFQTGDAMKLDEKSSIREWIGLVVYWIRELLWRRRFWSKMLRDSDTLKK